MPRSTSSRTSRVRSLDGLRAIALAAVVVYHAQSGWLPGGNLGVDVFFVLSGYLITSTLLREWGRRGRIALGRFWVRRLRRLFPALFAMIALVTAALCVFPADLRVHLGRQLFGGLTYTTNWISLAVHGSYFDHTAPSVFGHLWSLAVEEQFYLVWPLILLLVVRLHHRWSRSAIAVMLALAAALGMGLAYVPGADPSPVYLATQTHAFGLMLGAALAFWRPLGAQPELPVSRVVVRWLAAASGGVVLLGFVLLSSSSPVTYRGGMLFLSLAVVVLLSTLSDRRSAVTRLLECRPLVWIGERSYSGYLWHWPLILMGQAVAGRFFAGNVWALVVLGGLLPVTVTGVLAAASYRWLERPILQQGFLGSVRRARGWLASRRGMKWMLTGAGAAVTVLIVISVVTAPSQSTVQKSLQAGTRYVATAAPPRGKAPRRAPQRTAVATGRLGSLTVSGNRVLAAGDSVMLASAPALSERFPGILIDAVVARQAQPTLDRAEDWLRQQPRRCVVVLQVGTNGTVTRDQIQRFLRQAGPQRRVVLVTLSAQRPWIPGDNTGIRQAAQGRRNVAVADWGAVVSGHPELLEDDQVHPNRRGQAVYAQTVESALRTLGVTVRAAS